MEIKSFSVGELQTNCYIIWNKETNNCFIVDPGDDADFITTEVISRQLKPQAILLTHGHYDHCLGCLELKLNFNLPIYLDPKDNFLYQKAVNSAKHWSASEALKQPKTLPFPEKLVLDTEVIKVISTPGHTPGSVCFYFKPHLLTGDTLFAEGVGRTDFSYSSSSDLKKSLQTIKKLPPQTYIYPGHDQDSILEDSFSQIPDVLFT